MWRQLRGSALLVRSIECLRDPRMLKVTGTPFDSHPDVTHLVSDTLPLDLRRKLLGCVAWRWMVLSFTA
jgi:hypothetical protein